MAMALCELQLELQCRSYGASVSEADNSINSRSSIAETLDFVPKTPAGKESKKKLGVHKSSTNLVSRFLETKVEVEADADVRIDCVEMSECLQGTGKLNTTFPSSTKEKDFYEQCNSCQTSSKIYKAEPCSLSDIQTAEGIELYPYNKIGNFPSPRELASLDEKFLAKRCNLGYRASRILKLAQSVVEGRIQLRQLEEACSEPNLNNYNKLAEQLKEIDGFGPFTCDNVLVCMGFYHVIPTDSETIRHLNQVHSRNSTIQTVQRHVEAIYGKYAPFQFLAYWYAT
uniref:HhH-GPD domain-containing protein n=1 Tax=Davidia involucrata TaxID=16924 RepID=A0A5B7C109_DAVIN